MDRLYTPWRYDYITQGAQDGRVGVPPALSAWSQSSEPDRHCVFCNMIAAVDYAIANGMSPEDADRAALLLQRGPTCFLCLNRFPYASGHVLILPYRHLDSLAALELPAAQEMIAHAQRVERILRTLYHPAGLNFGLNLGQAGGAGVAAHIHMHALPRWIGDANFMTVTADTRILPETLEITWHRIREQLSVETPS